MPHDRILLSTAATLLIISVGLIIGGAALNYRDGTGAGADIYQFGRILLIGGGAASIWYFKWSRSERKKTGARTDKPAKHSLGMYAFWIVVILVLVGAVYLQRQGSLFVEGDRVQNFVVAVVPPILAALVVVFFLVRDSVRQRRSEKGPPRKRAGPRVPRP